MQAGLQAEKAYDEQTLEAAHKARRDVSLSGVFVQAARANGYTGSDRLNDGNMRAALLRYNRELYYDIKEGSTSKKQTKGREGEVD